MKMIRAAEYNLDSFTDKPDEDSWIFGRAWHESWDADKLDPEKDVMVFLSGWGMHVPKNKFVHRIGYSSHSSPDELQMFVKSICPKQLSFHSNQDTEDAWKFENDLCMEYTELKRKGSSISRDQWGFDDSTVVAHRFKPEVKREINK